MRKLPLKERQELSRLAQHCRAATEKRKGSRGVPDRESCGVAIRTGGERNKRRAAGKENEQDAERRQNQDARQSPYQGEARPDRHGRHDRKRNMVLVYFAAEDGRHIEPDARSGQRNAPLAGLAVADGELR
ncbi:MAG: hypothetical protein GEU87_03560 [Alphaproteobacteria bacterium]|nr:hypothetical protein [Alphaproteobacteria bacterium]